METDLKLAIDGTNTPHIFYAIGVRRYLHHTYWSGTSWHSEYVETFQNSSAIDVVIDDNNHLHLSVYAKLHDSMSEVLYYAYKIGNSWSRGTLPSIYSSVHSTSIDIDQFGNPVIAYDQDDHHQA